MMADFIDLDVIPEVLRAATVVLSILAAMLLAVALVLLIHEIRNGKD